MGPYMIQGRPKGSAGGNTLEIILCTESRFLDESGKPTRNESAAVRLEERLTTVLLRELGSVPAIPACPP